MVEIPRFQPPRFCGRCGQPLAEVQGQPGQRVCTGCARTTYLSPIPVVAAIVEWQDRIILVRSHGWPETWYGLITGFLEPGETTAAAAAREVQEETGLTPGPASLIGVYPFFEMNQIIIAYHMAATGTVTLDTGELADWKAVRIENLRPWPSGTGEALKDFLARRLAAAPIARAPLEG